MKLNVKRFGFINLLLYNYRNDFYINHFSLILF